MLRKFLAREGQFLLKEFNAPDARTLWRRVAFLAYVTAGTGIMLGGLVALYSLFGLAAMWLGVVAIYLLYIWLLRRTPVYRNRACLRSAGRTRCSRSIDRRRRKGAPNEAPRDP